ncbi:hypothetical protein BpHYR1_004844 [Brachionus plicatilis]|uniref:Uncharacterized protein n=1 Tax=Brachionus plicatilis TaxID=10195 RepID=A0A3M7P558_BRAPC|nr:hypothetical protein BpHYR1_004844 [Brachionus plicatilis]
MYPTFHVVPGTRTHNSLRSLLKTNLKDMGQSVILVDLDALIPNICVFFVLVKIYKNHYRKVKKCEKSYFRPDCPISFCNEQLIPNFHF